MNGTPSACTMLSGHRGIALAVSHQYGVYDVVVMDDTGDVVKTITGGVHGFFLFGSVAETTAGTLLVSDSRGVAHVHGNCCERWSLPSGSGTVKTVAATARGGLAMLAQGSLVLTCGAVLRLAWVCGVVRVMRAMEAVA